MTKILPTAISFVSTPCTITFKLHWEGCAVYTTQRLLIPCGVENTFLFRLARFYSQSLCLTLPTVVPLLKYICSHPAAPSGSCCDPGEAQLVPQSCLADVPVEESRVPGCCSAAPADRHSQGPDPPLQEPNTSHHLLTFIPSDGNEQNPSLGNSQASKPGCDLKSKRHWWNKGQGDENVSTRSNLFWGILIHSFDFYLTVGLNS